jgi:predicted alpha/beta superfamily hydrolase
MITPGPRVRPLACAALFPALLLAACAGTPVAPAAPPVGRTPIAGWEGKLTTYDVVSPVPGIDSRPVTVLVPPDYSDAANASRRYPVLYMHDGNNCLDHDLYAHGGWQVHTVSYDLVQKALMGPAILVLVDNIAANRGAEYVPGFGAAPGPSADGYLDFLEKTVVPFVDSNFRTLPGAASRGIGGSSYGGLISLYGAWTRPQVFGFAMAMSTAFAYDFHALVQRTPVAPPLRIYIDSGTVDWSGGDDGMAKTLALRDLLASKGFTLGKDLQHFVGQGHNHSEDFWRLRLPVALPFLLPPSP